MMRSRERGFVSEHHDQMRMRIIRIWVWGRVGANVFNMICVRMERGGSECDKNLHNVTDQSHLIEFHIMA